MSISNGKKETMEKRILVYASKNRFGNFLFPRCFIAHFEEIKSKFPNIATIENYIKANKKV